MFLQLRLLFIHYENLRKMLLQLINKNLAFLDTDEAVHTWGSEGLGLERAKGAKRETYVILSIIESYSKQNKTKNLALKSLFWSHLVE